MNVATMSEGESVSANAGSVAAVLRNMSPS